MREYFARVARKAKTAQAAEAVVPNLPPVFPPQHAVPETDNSWPSTDTVDVSGKTGFRHRSYRSESQNQNAKDEFAQTAESSADALPGIAQFSPSQVLQPVHVIQPQPPSKFRQYAPESVADSETIFPQIESSSVVPRLEILTKTEHARLSTKAAIVKRSDSESLEKHGVTSLSELGEIPGGGVHHELKGQPQNSKRSIVSRQSVDRKPEETSVHVRIGKIEIRTAPPVQVLGSAQAQKKVPRGFAVYESVRRYVTRHRF